MAKNTAETPAQKQITIQGVTTSVSAPYAEGHTCTAAEAAALNQVRAENIRNNQAKHVKDLKEQHGDDSDALQSAVDQVIGQYDSEYEFTLASVGGGGRSALSPVEKEARSIARELINTKLREAGTTQKAYCEEHGEDAIKTKIAEVAQMDEVVKMAEETVRAREAAAKEAPQLSI